MVRTVVPNDIVVSTNKTNAFAGISKTASFKTMMFFADVAGDFMSNGTGGGAWTSYTSWLIFNGTTWGPAPMGVYPSSGTYSVSIQMGDTITLSSDSTTPIQIGNLNIDGTLVLGDGLSSNNSQLEFIMNTNLITVGSSGTLKLDNKFIRLKLPSGSSIIIQSGGNLTTYNPCNSNKEIYIGNFLYAACKGGGGAYSFDGSTFPALTNLMRLS
jgi:hypothetical protein